MEETGNIRAFVAIELPAEARDYCDEVLARAKRLLASAQGAVRWIRPEGIHVTLKFLGSVPGEQVPELTQRLMTALTGQAPFDVTLHDLGVFSSAESPRVIWLGLEGNLRALGQAQERVEEATGPLGYPRDKRPYRPHLTLGRVREDAPLEELAEIGQLPSEWPRGPGCTFRVTSASLMRSNLSRGGARYTRLADIPFASG